MNAHTDEVEEKNESEKIDLLTHVIADLNIGFLSFLGLASLFLL